MRIDIAVDVYFYVHGHQLFIRETERMRKIRHFESGNIRFLMPMLRQRGQKKGSGAT